MRNPDWASVLEPGEALLWHGAPIAGVRLRRRWQDLSAGLWGMATCAGLWGVYIYLAGQKSGVGLVVAGWIILALIFAIFALSLYHILVKHRAATRILDHSQYAVTGRRALVLESGRKSQVLCLSFTAATNLHVTENSPATLSLWDNDGGGTKGAEPAALQFHYIERGDEPARIIRGILEALSEPKPQFPGGLDGTQRSMGSRT